MVLKNTESTIAYRCPHCGSGILAMVGVFALSGDMIKLKCDCKQSEMTLVHRPDGKVRLTVPCLVCTQPHNFTVSSSLFYNKELFVLSCPYSDLALAFLGEMNTVKAELARTELELMDMMEQSGIRNFDALHDDEQTLPDEQIRDIVMFVIHDLDAEGKIYCKCDASDNGREYDAEILDESIRVSCKKCGASRHIPTDSRLGAHAFLNADSLTLE